MRAINMAAKSLCEWIHAMNNFMDIFDEIQLKKDNCKQMDKQLIKANKELAEKQKQLDNVIKEVQTLEKVYNTNKSDKDTLDMEIKQTEDRLIRAN